MKILIVEDDFISRKVMHRILSPHGETDIAVNGREALTAFKAARAAKTPYDLICLDIMMPEMDGLQVLKEIRTIEAESGIGGLEGVKVIMTTAMGNKESILNAFRSGCEAYVVKPVDPHKLLEKVRELGLIKA